MAQFRNQLLSINDFEQAYGSPEMGRLAFQSTGIQKYGSRLQKLLTTADSGTQQNIVGPAVWANMSTERSFFAAVRKKEWTESGIRVSTAYPSTKISAVSEATSTLNPTVKPSFAQYFPNIKLMETSSDQSLVSKYHGQIAEALTMEQLRDLIGITHGKGINTTFNADPSTAVAGDSFESLYRVTGSFAEEQAQSLAAGRMNIYGLNRDMGATFADAQYLHNSGTARDLSLRLLNSLQRVTWLASGDYNPAHYWWYTGLDTLQTWQELLQPQQRFDEKPSTMSPLNGVTLGTGGSKGAEFLLHTYNGQPIIVSADAIKGNGSISKVCMFHRDHIWFQVVQPTVYRQAGLSTGQEILLASYTDKMLFYTVGDLVSNFLGANGKLDDLK